MQAHIDTWRKELHGDPDECFILHGIINGFSLIDTDPSTIPTAIVPNHPSATNPQTLHKVEHRILEEMEDGNYIITQEAPTITSALAAIEKPDGDIRLIHDMSRPLNSSAKDFAIKDECHYINIEDALQFCKPHSYLCKVDLKWAYRSFSIPTIEHMITGLQWTFTGDHHPTFLMDSKLPFGARKSPAIYNRITQAIQRMMRRRGFQVCAYLDDFLCIEDSKESCQLALNTLITLLRDLGLRINWKKVVDPCKCLTYLGIEINSVAGTLKLDQAKAMEICALLRQHLAKKCLSKRLLQTLAGKLNWAANVHPWGRAYMSVFYQAIGILQHSHHKFIITPAMRLNMLWWEKCLAKDIHVRLIWDNRHCVAITTDSSSVGAGGFCLNDGDICYINWILDKPYLANAHINIKELAAVLFCLQRWAPAYQGSHFYVHTDNFMTMCALNNHYSSHPSASRILQEIAQLVIQHDILITAHYIKGALNDIADALSRLHTPGQLLRLSALLHEFHGLSLGYLLPYHMSTASFTFISPHLQKLHHLFSTWTVR